VIGLHLLIAAALLHAVVLEPSQKHGETEVPLELMPLQPATKAAAKTAAGGSGGGVAEAPVPVFGGTAGNVLNLGQALFGCNPENLRNLTREQQEKCLKFSAGRYVAMKDGLPVYIKPPGPEWEGLRNSDLRARERNTADPCLAAKQTGTECIHTVIYGKGLW